MSTLTIGQRVAVVGGRHFNRGGVVVQTPTGYPQSYRVRLDGKTGLTVLVAPHDLAAVKR